MEGGRETVRRTCWCRWRETDCEEDVLVWREEDSEADVLVWREGESCEEDVLVWREGDRR